MIHYHQREGDESADEGYCLLVL